MPGLERLRWQVVLSPALSTHLEMALDEVLLGRLAGGRRGPTLRLWKWAEPTLIIGSHQVVANEVDAAEAARLGFTVTRRMSGGGTMIAEPGRTITYSLYAPAELVRGLSFVDSFAHFDAWAVACLQGLGVPATYRPINDIVSPAGKIGGAAQARRGGAVLHHTTIAHQLDPALVPRLIRIGRPALSPRGVRSAEKVVSPLSAWTTATQADVTDALAACFKGSHPTGAGEIDDDELAEARALTEFKYGRQAWIDRLR
ncbi:MAG: lipoate--protein ligase family protein [Candidatus Dormibacteraeota bacterium]|nr:lipoate--protein ligase family protein [Candidatus Dormibacteraeota bacterium]